MGKFFNIRLRPDIVNGDISPVIANDKTDNPFANNDVLFDWHKFEIPATCRLVGVTAVVNGEDGVTQGTARDMEIIFAKAINGVAPTTIGNVNATATSLNIQNHVIGGLTIDKDNGAFGTDSCAIFSTAVGSADGGHAAIVLDAEPTPAGVQEIYIAGIIKGSVDFSTGVLSTEAIDASSAEKATIAVDTVDARLVFSPGDKVYVHDVDTQIPGTVKTVAQNLLTFDTTNSTVDVANNDEIINATPIKFTLHCEL